MDKLIRRYDKYIYDKYIYDKYIYDRINDLIKSGKDFDDFDNFDDFDVAFELALGLRLTGLSGSSS